ncbi:MAG: MMPL family transporter, partial [Actinobacteria bacterium]|nr:MMPL family transporter [Actinomycetota bacterium]
TTFSLPGTESQRAFDLLKAKFPARSGDTAQIVFAARGPGGVRAPGVQARMESAFAAAKRASSHVSAIADPYRPEGERQISSDGSVAFATIQLDVRFNSLPKDAASNIQDAVVRAAHPDAGLDVEFGGNAFTKRTPPGGTEAVGFLAAVAILLIAFGSVLAMFLPIFIAIVAIVIGLGLIGLLANVMQVVSFTGLIAAMIGIGVGIDYALFIVTRFRHGLHDGMEPADAVATAIDTSGRAVLFAGCTVVIALMGMWIMGLSFVNSLAVGAALAVLITMFASVTLLPAMLGFCGRNIDKWHLPALHRAAAAAHERGGFWYRWSRRIQRRPWPFALVALALLLVLAFPVTHLRLGNPDAGNDPPASTTRKAYDLLSKGFGPGYNGALTLAASLGQPGDVAVMQRLAGALARDPGVASVGRVAVNNPADPTAATISVIPTTSPQDARTATLVRHLRRDVIAPAVAGTDVTVHSGGNAAIAIDLTKKLSSRLPWFFGAVIALSFILLMVVFRSLLVPLKAALMNVFSIAASFGILVAVFQWGWGASLLGIGKKGPIVAFSPMMLFAILFGLSMDYEVFLLSRVKEEHDRTGDNGLAVADGLAATARVITAAAAIMVAVFLTFVFQTEVTAKLIGLGLACAILIDATVVRMVLVPATMELLGEANWWLPRWLERRLPNISVEGSHHDAGAPALVHDDKEAAGAGARR